MANTAYRFHLRAPMSTELRAILGEVPGLFIKERLVVAPLNAAWLAERILRSLTVEWTVTTPKPRPRITKDALRAMPELREWVFDFLAPFQKEGVLFALNEPDESALLVHPTGAGKSLEGIVWGLFRPGPIIFVTRAGARRTIQIEVERYTTVRPVVIWPESDRRFDPALQLAGQRIIIVAWNALPAKIEELLNVNPASVIYDELHIGKGSKRWEAIPGRDAEGNDTKSFKRLENIVACAARLSANTQRRLGMTATFVPDRPRDLWGQLDLVQPGRWGSYWGRIDKETDQRSNSFTQRYCDLAKNGWGGWDDQGASNIDELKKRLWFMMHEVDSTVTHRDLPPKRRQVVYLTKADQNPPSAFTDELRKAQKAGRGQLQEVRLAEAASRKRGYVVDEIVEAVKSKQKVVVFTGRHRDCDRLAEAVQKAVDESVPVFSVHGGAGTAKRDEIQALWMGNITNPTAGPPLEGPAVLIGTHQAWGTSVSLHDSDLLLIVQLPINAKELWQTEGRVYRQGQRRPVLVKYVVAEGTYDEAVASILLSKLSAVADIQKESQFKESRDQLMGREDADKIEQRLLAVVNHDPEELFKEFAHVDDQGNAAPDCAVGDDEIR